MHFFGCCLFVSWAGPKDRHWVVLGPNTGQDRPGSIWLAGTHDGGRQFQGMGSKPQRGDGSPSSPLKGRIPPFPSRGGGSAKRGLPLPFKGGDRLPLEMGSPSPKWRREGAPVLDPGSGVTELRFGATCPQESNNLQ